MESFSFEIEVDHADEMRLFLFAEEIEHATKPLITNERESIVFTIVDATPLQCMFVGMKYAAMLCISGTDFLRKRLKEINS